MHITIQWVPGHVGVDRNEVVDEEVKLAAQGKSSLLHDVKSSLADPLLWSKSATIATFTKCTKQEWTSHWLFSPKCCFLKKISTLPPSNKTTKVYATLSRLEASLLTQLHTSHIGLNTHLHCIWSAASPNCKVFNASEMVSHFLLSC